MLAAIFYVVLKLSFAGSVVALVLLILRVLFWRRLPAGLQYALWGLLVIRLFLPFAPASPVSVFAVPAPTGQINAVPKTASIPSHSDQMAASPVTRPAVSSPASFPIQSVGSGSSNPDTASVPVTHTVNESFPIRIGINKETAAFFWLLGVCALLFYALAVNLAERRRLHAAERCRDEALLSLLEDCTRQLKLRGNVELVYDESACSPGLFGVFRPKLVLSRTVTARLSKTELRYIFLHELTHLRRRDNAVSLLVLLLRAVNWFNPVLHIAFAKMREDCELACDASVLAAIGEGARRGYGNTIVTVMQTKPGAKNLPGAAGFSGGFCKRRIVMIANGKRKVPLILATLVLVTALLAGCASLPAKAQASVPASTNTSSVLSSSNTASSGATAFTLSDPTLLSSTPTVRLPYSKSEIAALYHKYFDLSGGQKNALAAHGFTKAQIANIDSEDFNQIELTFRLSKKDIESQTDPNLKKMDLSKWTYGDLDAYKNKQANKTYALTAKQAAQLKKRGISLKLAREMLKDYCTYANLLAQPDAKLQKVMKLYLQADAVGQAEMNKRAAIRIQYMKDTGSWSNIPEAVKTSTVATPLSIIRNMAENHGYQVQSTLSAGDLLQLPKNANSVNTQYETWKFLMRCCGLSHQNGLDFTPYLGTKVTLYSCDGKNKKDGQTTELLAFFFGKNLVGFWAMPPLKSVGLPDVSYTLNRDSSVLKHLWCISTQKEQWDSYLAPWIAYDSNPFDKLCTKAEYRIEVDSANRAELMLPANFGAVFDGYSVGAYLRACNVLSAKYGYNFSPWLGKKVTFYMASGENVKTRKTSDIFALYSGKKLIGFWFGDDKSWRILDSYKAGLLKYPA